MPFTEELLDNKKMASESTSMEVAMNFYEEKNVEKFLAEAKEKGVSVRIHDEKKDEFVDYVVGGVIHVVRFAKPGKPVAVTVRPVI
jgi:hypothetical protein